MESISLKCMTWNILAQQWYENGRTTFAKVIPWPERLATIIDFIQNSNCDIICLQEVDLRTCSDDFAGLNDDYNYVVHEITKKRNSNIGNIILWKRSELDLIASDLRAYAIHVILLHKKTNKELWFSNVHLKAGLTSGELQRLSQFDSCLNAWKKTKHIACICGDFNDDLQNDGLLNKCIKAINFELDKHGQQMKSFKCNIGPPSCCIGNQLFPFDHALTSDFLMEYEYGITLKNISVDISTDISADISTDIPNENMPSDHFPVRFTLRF